MLVILSNRQFGNLGVTRMQQYEWGDKNLKFSRTTLQIDSAPLATFSKEEHQSTGIKSHTSNFKIRPVIVKWQMTKITHPEMTKKLSRNKWWKEINTEFQEIFKTIEQFVYNINSHE